MIIFQIIAALIILVPMTVLLFIVFNFYLIHWLYLSLVVVLLLIYSTLCSLVLAHINTMALIFIGLLIFYILRMRYLVIKSQNKNSPCLRGKFRSTKANFYIAFLVPLSFLQLLRLLPTSINQHISRKLELDISIPALIDLILESCQGTKMEIVDATVNLFFEIQ